MKIKKMNRNMLPAFRNKLSPAPEIFDNEGKNKAAVHEIIHIIAPQFNAEILFNLFKENVQELERLCDEYLNEN